VLTTSPITKIAFQRGTNGGVYVGNATGVYYKNKTMSNWVELGTGLPDVDVRFMFVNTFRNKLLIGTSRGAWEHDLYEASATKAFITVDNSNPDCNEPVVSFRDNSTVTNSASGVKYNWSFPGGTPSTSTLECPKVSYKNATPGNYSVSLTVTDKNGSNTQTLTNFITYTKGNLCCQDVTNNWTLKELGSNTLKGAVCYTPVNDNYKFTTKTAGFDNVYDSIPFVYQVLTGDGDIIAKVTSLSNDWNYTGGVMIRTNLNPNSAYAFVGALDNRGIIDTYRNTNGANSGYLGAKTISFPMWVKVAKTGNTYKTYYSKDTTTWTLYGTHNLPAATQTYIGITAGNKNCIANMSNVRIKGTVQILTGVNNEVNSSLSIYPNPAENFVNITGLEGINEVRLIDISGVELKTFTTENPDLQINLENYPSGMYLLKVKNASTKNEQIIKVVHQQK
jgi:PKD repeat protein